MKKILIAVSVAGLVAAAVSVAVAGDPPTWTATTPATSATTPAATATAPAATAPAMQHQHFTPADIKWSDAPPGLPKGAKVSVLEGDPAAPGLFTMRAWLPAGYKVAPHWHPAVEHVTVISGVFYMAVGETWDETKGHALPVGSFSYMPQGQRHFAWTKEETVIQIHGIGPWGITYVNPSDDPRNQKQATK